MNKQKKDKWINDVLGSSDAIQRAQPSSGLFDAIESKLSSRVDIVRNIPLRTTMVAAASLLLLISANIFLLQTNNASTKTDVDDIDAIVEYYGFDDNTTNIMTQ